MSLNKVCLIGNLGQDPEIKYMPSGDPVANFSLATSERWKDKNTGEQKEKTEWHRIAVFGKVVEAVIAPYVKKGSKLYIEGKLQTRKWQDQQGQDRYTTEIVLSGFDCKIELLNKVDAQTQQNQGGYQQPPAQQQAPQMAPQQAPQMATHQHQAPAQTQYNEPLNSTDGKIPF